MKLLCSPLLLRIQINFIRYAMHYTTIDYKERCGLLHILPLSFHMGTSNFFLNHYLLYVSDVSNSVASLLSYYEPDRRLRSNQTYRTLYNYIHFLKMFQTKRIPLKMIKRFVIDDESIKLFNFQYVYLSETR